MTSMLKVTQRAGLIPVAAAIASTLLMAACASNDPPKLSGSTVPERALMQESELAGSTALVYREPNVDPRYYTRFIIARVQIYGGADADWGSSTPQDRQEMARYMESEFAQVLQQRHQLAQTPGPGVARLNLILAGLQSNVPVASTLSHLVPAGVVLNVAKSASGEPGSFTGSVTIAGAIVDSQTNATLMSFVQKRSPNALNIGATLSSRTGWQAAEREFADAFGRRLDAIHK